jgi:AcrR family transcriptional regulator
MMNGVARGPSRLTGPQRRATVLEAAARAFAANGYYATSMREIARLAGVTKPVLYDHFSSKQELYIALIEGVRDELTSGTGSVMATSTPLDGRIRAAIDRFFGYVEAHPAATRVLFTPPEGEPTIVEAARRVQNEATARLVAHLGVEHDLVPNAPERELTLSVFTEFLKTGLHGLALWWAGHPEVSRTVLVEGVMSLAWAGLRSQLDRPQR